MSYLRYKDKHKDGSSSNEEASAEESSKYIDMPSESVASHYHCCQYNAGHIGGCYNLLCII